MKYAVVYERSPRNFPAYVPDLPACVATGRTRAQVQQRIKEAIRLHIEALKDEDIPVPQPSTWSELVEV